MPPNPNRDQQSGPPLNSCAMAAMAAELSRRVEIQARHGDLIGQDLSKAAARSSATAPTIWNYPTQPHGPARNSREIALQG